MCTHCCDKIEELTHKIVKLNSEAEKREERIAPTNIKKARVHVNFKLRRRSHELHVLTHQAFTTFLVKKRHVFLHAFNYPEIK